MCYLTWLCQLQFSFDVGILTIFGQLNAIHKEELKKNYWIMDKGYNSFPTNIPGTLHNNAVLVSKTWLQLPIIYSLDHSNIVQCFSPNLKPLT